MKVIKSNPAWLVENPVKVKLKDSFDLFNIFGFIIVFLNIFFLL